MTVDIRYCGYKIIVCELWFLGWYKPKISTSPSFIKIYNDLPDFEWYHSPISNCEYDYLFAYPLIPLIKTYIGLNQIYNLSMKRERA
jgi:hypothetical protein